MYTVNKYGMRVAVLIQGEPRFSAEFDRFIENLSEYDSVDYFVCTWKESDPNGILFKTDGHKIVAPRWQNVDHAWAINKFNSILPENHRIVFLDLIDQNTIKHDPVESNFAQETNQANVWKMLYSLQKANDVKCFHEKNHGFTYDLVIRTRPDVALNDKINLRSVKEYLDARPNTIQIPQNKKCGYGVYICDLFAIGSSENMNTYCNLYNEVLEHHSRGVIFHPETLLAKHLAHHGIQYESGSFNIEFRNLGKWQDRTTGETWSSHAVPGWENKIYISDFGRWE